MQKKKSPHENCRIDLYTCDSLTLFRYFFSIFSSLSLVKGDLMVFLWAHSVVNGVYLEKFFYKLEIW